VLERELERREREAARGQHDRDENEVLAPAHGLLRRDIGGRVQDSGRAREADARRQAEEGGRRDERRDHEPESERQGRRGASSGAARERQPEQHEPGDGGRCSRLLRPAEASAGERQHDHSPRCSGLDERERRESERDDIRRPSCEAEGNAGDPDPPTEQRASRARRTPERQSRKLCRLTVLQREPAADRARGRKPEQQPRSRPAGHRPAARVWNGR
jgi:hypothetical protein